MSLEKAVKIGFNPGDEFEFRPLGGLQISPDPDAKCCFVMACGLEFTKEKDEKSDFDPDFDPDFDFEKTNDFTQRLSELGPPWLPGSVF